MSQPRNLRRVEFEPRGGWLSDGQTNLIRYDTVSRELGCESANWATAGELDHERDVSASHADGAHAWLPTDSAYGSPHPNPLQKI